MGCFRRGAAQEHPQEHKRLAAKASRQRGVLRRLPADLSLQHPRFVVPREHARREPTLSHACWAALPLPPPTPSPPRPSSFSSRTHALVEALRPKAQSREAGHADHSQLTGGKRAISFSRSLECPHLPGLGWPPHGDSPRRSSERPFGRPALCLAELPLPLQRAGVEALHGHAAAPPRAAVDAAEPAAPDQVRRRAARDGGELAGREHLSGRRGFRG